MEELKTFKVYYGEYRDPSTWECEAKNAEHAKTLFRKKFGFDFIKIQKVVEVNN